MKIKKSIVKTHPYLMDEWDFGKNKIRPEEVTFGSGKRVWWTCKKEECKYSWSASISKRTTGKKGCPACVGQAVSDKNNLAVKFPNLVEEWDYEKNKNFKPSGVTSGSGKKVWWICRVCDYSWETYIYTRTSLKKCGCPACAGRVLTKDSNLFAMFSSISKEWDYEKNDFGPRDISAGSHKRAWWLCSKCGFSWPTQIDVRTRLKCGCPACVNQSVSSRNNLLTNHPDLAKEWDYDKNSLLPDQVVVGANTKVWWKCEKCGHGWAAFIYKRTQGTGCSVCAQGSSISKVSQEWLDSLGIKIREHKIKIGNFSFKVDGFDPKTNIVYEFLGDYWHGNPKIFAPEKINPSVKKSFGQLHQETFRRFRLLEKAGFKVIYIWEKDFKGQV